LINSRQLFSASKLQLQKCLKLSRHFPLSDSIKAISLDLPISRIIPCVSLALESINSNNEHDSFFFLHSRMLIRRRLISKLTLNLISFVQFGRILLRISRIPASKLFSSTEMFKPSI
jgi:hypothetical protein